jgi:hypothetical protein
LAVLIGVEIGAVYTIVCSSVLASSFNPVQAKSASPPRRPRLHIRALSFVVHQHAIRRRKIAADDGVDERIRFAAELLDCKWQLLRKEARTTCRHALRANAQDARQCLST